MGPGITREKALLIGTPRNKAEWEIADSLEELSRLAETAGARVVKTLVQSLKKVDAALLIGKGKAEEVQSFIASQPVDVIIFDDELTPTQQRNLETLFKTKTIDRTALILDIFAQRARSGEGKLQVELAQLTYTLPRLTGKGVSLSRLGGGIGTRGPGETRLEVDRRRIKERITRLNRELDKVHIAALHRFNREGPFTLHDSPCRLHQIPANRPLLRPALQQARVLVEEPSFWATESQRTWWLWGGGQGHGGHSSP